MCVCFRSPRRRVTDGIFESAGSGWVTTVGQAHAYPYAPYSQWEYAYTLITMQLLTLSDNNSDTNQPILKKTSN